MRARFIVLDGIDGCGKSTQAKRLVEVLSSRGAVLHVREPGSTRAGERIRELLLSRELEWCAASEALMFAAARRQTLEELVRPALKQGQSVVCERFHASTFAYQAVAGSLNEAALLGLLSDWAGTPEPDLELILRLDVAEAARRRGQASDRIEDKGLAYQAKVAEGYSRYLSSAPRALAIDASGTADAVHARILATLKERLKWAL